MAAKTCFAMKLKFLYVASFPNRWSVRNCSMMEKFCLGGKTTEGTVKHSCCFKRALYVSAYGFFLLTQLETLCVGMDNE